MPIDETPPGSSANHARLLKTATGSTQNKALSAVTPPFENSSNQIPAKRRASMLDITQYPRDAPAKRRCPDTNAEKAESK